MGQGLYNMLGYGTLDAPVLDEMDPQMEETAAELYDVVKGGLAYETDPYYVCIPLAVDDEWLQEYWEMPALPESVYRCAPRRARYAEDTLTFPVPQEAVARWRQAQALYQRVGLTLPDARLIVVNDWD